MNIKGSKDADVLRVEEKGHLKSALDAIRDLAVERLQTDRRTRFSEVSRICEVARSLLQAEGQAAISDPDKTLQDEIGTIRVAQQYAVNYGYMTDDIVPTDPLGPGDRRRAEQLERGPYVQTATQSARAQMASAEAAELRALAEVASEGCFDGEDQETLKTRMERLLANIKERNDAYLVHPDIPRGHQAGVDGPEGDVAPRVVIDGSGAPGNGGPAGEGNEEGPAGEVLGGPEDVPSRAGGDSEDGVGDAGGPRGPDREGPGVPLQGAQA